MWGGIAGLLITIVSRSLRQGSKSTAEANAAPAAASSLPQHGGGPSWGGGRAGRHHHHHAAPPYSFADPHSD